MTRTFRAFMEKEDLQDVFTRFQSLLPVYYTPTYSDSGPVTWEDITVLPGLGVNTRGEHIGNCQLRIFPRQTSCTWRSYQCLSPDNTHTITRHTTLCDENTSAVDIDLGGLYQGEVLFHRYHPLRKRGIQKAVQRSKKVLPPRRHNHRQWLLHRPPNLQKPQDLSLLYHQHPLPAPLRPPHPLTLIPNS